MSDPVEPPKNSIRWGLHSVSLAFPVRVDAKTYKTYTVEGGERAETISFGQSRLNRAKTTVIPSLGTETTYSRSLFPEAEFFGFANIFIAI